MDTTTILNPYQLALQNRNFWERQLVALRREYAEAEAKKNFAQCKVINAALMNAAFRLSAAQAELRALPKHS